MTTTQRKQQRSPHQPTGCWCRPEKRLAIYLRDGLACAWCGHSIEDGASLSLDHLTCQRDGGSHDASNLITACERCNKSRGARSVKQFATAVAAYLNHGVKPAEILSHIRACMKRDLTPAKAEAKAMIARRGSYARVMASL